MDCFIGIDVGTTNIKAAAYSIEGKLLAYHSECAEILKPSPEMSEFRPEEIWKCVCSCLQAISNKIAPNLIKSIGVSSMAEAGVPLDSHGKVLYPIIAWYDPRAKKQVEYLEQRVGRKKIYSITGQTPSDKYGICKLMWIKDNLPKIFSKTAHWLSVEDWVIYCLTGEFATDYSIASRTMAFDISRLKWSQELLDAVEISPSIFPKAYPGGTAVGCVSDKVAQNIGLNEGITVVTGGHDHACASIGINILEDGVVLDSMGTAEVSMVATSKLVLNDETYARYYSTYPHCGDKMYRILTSNQSCGAAIEWFFNSLGRDILIEFEKTNKTKYDLMVERAMNEASFVDGLYFFPFIRGSVESKSIRGTFFGIKDSHMSGDFVKALVDGLCYELKIQLNGYEQIFSDSFNKLRVVGGISKSDYIMQSKASISNRKVEVPVNTESACYGAAILGAIGVGAMGFSDVPKMYKCGEQYYAETRLSKGGQAYAQYLNIREKLKDIYNLYY